MSGSDSGSGDRMAAVRAAGGVRDLSSLGDDPRAVS